MLFARRDPHFWFHGRDSVLRVYPGAAVGV
jgi:hypothetical protein